MHNYFQKQKFLLLNINLEKSFFLLWNIILIFEVT